MHYSFSSFTPFSAVDFLAYTAQVRLMVGPLSQSVCRLVVPSLPPWLG